MVIKDSKGDVIALETTNPDVWDTLVSLHNNQTEMWITWYYRRIWQLLGTPIQTRIIVIAQITTKGAQSNIQGINENLNYWMNVWNKETYVLARVIEIHG